MQKKKDPEKAGWKCKQDSKDKIKDLKTKARKKGEWWIERKRKEKKIKLLPERKFKKGITKENAIKINCGKKNLSVKTRRKKYITDAQKVQHIWTAFSLRKRRIKYNDVNEW